MSLKTLKDFEENIEKLKLTRTGDDQIDLIEKQVGVRMDFIIDELKQEAIKWMKWIDKDFENKEHPGLKSYEEKCAGLSATYEWIRKFFNIEESEL